MTTPLGDTRDRILLAAFQMPSRQNMVQRKSSITNAFVNAIIPVVQPSVEEIAEALSILKITPENVTCAYCGDSSSEWDHLRPLVRNQRPTGFVSEIANLVPACGKCNQSKGNKEWRQWILSNARLSPTGRRILDTPARVELLDKFERWRSPTLVDFPRILGTEAWTHYWSLCDEINSDMREAQVVAESMRIEILRRIA